MATASGALVLAILAIAGNLLSPAKSLPLEVTSGFHAATCPQLEGIVTSAVQTALQGEIALAAGLLRIFFHDCFPNGCDASIYIVGRGESEQSMGPNFTLQLRALQLVESIRAKVHAACGATVSCADISALATRAVVVVSGGPTFFERINPITFDVPQGVLDSLAPAPADAVSDLPGPRNGNVTALADAFGRKGLNELADLVALSGAHTIGRAACQFFSTSRARDGDAFGNRLAANCSSDSSRLQNLDVVTPDLFDNGYYMALVASQGVFTSDMALIRDARTAPIVRQFAASKDAFFAQFAKSMTKLANAPRPGGNVGEIRRNCFQSNDPPSVIKTEVAAGDEGFAASA